MHVPCETPERVQPKFRYLAPSSAPPLPLSSDFKSVVGGQVSTRGTTKGVEGWEQESRRMRTRKSKDENKKYWKKSKLITITRDKPSSPACSFFFFRFVPPPSHTPISYSSIVEGTGAQNRVCFAPWILYLWSSVSRTKARTATKTGADTPNNSSMKRPPRKNSKFGNYATTGQTTPKGDATTHQ